MKRILFAIVIVVMVISLALSCAPKPAPAPTPTPTPTPAPAPPPAPKAPERLVFFSLRPGTSVYATQVGLSQLINQYTDLKTIVQPFPRADARYDMFRKGDVQLATGASFSIYHNVYNLPSPTHPEVPGAPYPELRTLIGGNYLYFGWLTHEGTGIKTMEQLKGRKVCATVQVQPTNTVFNKDLLKAYGLDPEKDVQDIPFPTTTAATVALIAKKVEAVGTSLGGAKMAELDAKAGAVVIPLTPDKVKQIREVPEALYPITAPNYLSGVHQDTPSYAGQNILICRDDLSDEIAYEVVKVIIEHAKELETVSTEFKEWGKDWAIPREVFLPFHPGAIKYLKEQGLWSENLEAKQKELIAKIEKLAKP